MFFKLKDIHCNIEKLLGKNWEMGKLIICLKEMGLFYDILKYHGENKSKIE